MLIENKVPITDKEQLLLQKSIVENPYCLYKPYPKQLIPIILANREEKYAEDGTKKPNTVLAGAGGYGGKTFLVLNISLQNIHFKQHLFFL